ncbi:MAG TPA: aminotransferase class I/II-fold pyridoxal phosphate-dependent enzyme, partial [Accumulibacter sp.]|nr:aminotransferase class I/II-fold pyridoxal phosphate-dependent enzyme [Accumulibacter sp.]
RHAPRRALRKERGSYQGSPDGSSRRDRGAPRIPRVPNGILIHTDLERLLADSSAKRKLILSDAVFSMDGDLAPLPGLLALAERFDAWLVVDDAHGFGVLGRQGRGSVDHFRLPASPRLLYMGTLGKAAGVAGAFVAGEATVIEWLVQRARSYIFTTAGSPMVACALAASLQRIADDEQRRQRLWQLIAQLRDGLAGTGWHLLPSPTAIQPVIVGDNHRTLQLAEALHRRGLWVPAIRPPTVPAGTARLRISLTAAHQPAQVACLVDALRELA